MLNKSDNLNPIIIVGAGIAGINLAFTLYFNNINFIIIDNNKNITSKVAAGLYNPIVFKRIIPSWKAGKLIDYLDGFYSKVENLIDCKFHYKIDGIKIITGENESNLWLKKALDQENSEFIKPEILVNNNLSLKAENGFGEITKSGRVDLDLFISKSIEYFKLKNKYIEDEFDYSQINPLDSIYKQIKFSKIVFCEGIGVLNNPYFNFIKLNPSKGEVLTIKSEGLKTNHTIHKNMFVLPTKDDNYIVGSTYSWDKLDNIPTQEGKNELVLKLEQIIACDYKINDHKAGVRPTVIDRRPILGAIKKYPNLFIFNGLGTKGVMISPYFANQLYENIIFNSKIDIEVDVNRFLSNN